MKRAGRIPMLLAMAAIALAPCASCARAATITIGSPLTGSFPTSPTSGCDPRYPYCTTIQSALPGATLTSPVDGLVIRWRVLSPGASSAYRLRVLSNVGGLEYRSVASTPEESTQGVGLETFETALPIKAGQTVGLDGLSPLTFRPVTGARAITFLPGLTDGAAGLGFQGSGTEYGFDAEIQPPPTITSISPGSGPVVGNNSVVIGGEDFEGATEVRFGDLKADFIVDSEGQITATAPATGVSKSVPVTVVTPAGSTVSSMQYAYDTAVDEREEHREAREQRELERREREERRLEGCVVPRLKGKGLRASRQRLLVSLCTVGKVRKRRGATAKTGKVVGQRPPAGTALPAEAKVNLTLGR